MKPLKVIAIVAEAVVVCTLAVSSYNAAFGGRDGINWMAAAPLLTVVALESLRIPTALNLIKAGPITILMSLALILGSRRSIAQRAFRVTASATMATAIARPNGSGRA